MWEICQVVAVHVGRDRFVRKVGFAAFRLLRERVELLVHLRRQANGRRRALGHIRVSRSQQAGLYHDRTCGSGRVAGSYSRGVRASTCIFPSINRRNAGGLAGGAPAQQELAAGFDHGLAVIGDDVGGGVGFAPPLGQVGAGAGPPLDMRRVTGYIRL